MSQASLSVLCNVQTELKPKRLPGYFIALCLCLVLLIPKICRSYMDVHAVVCVCIKPAFRIWVLNLKTLEIIVFPCNFDKINIEARSEHFQCGYEIQYDVGRQLFAAFIWGMSVAVYLRTNFQPPSKGPLTLCLESVQLGSQLLALHA